MLKSTLISLALMILTTKAHAFDPLTVAVTANTAQSLLSQAQDVSETSLSFLELMNDLGSDTEASEKELSLTTEKLNLINTEAREIKTSNDDLKFSLEMQNSQNQSLHARIKALRNTIQATKHLAELMGLKPKMSEKNFHLQEIKLSTMTLEELQALRRAQYITYLDAEEAKMRREIYLQKILETEKATQNQQTKKHL